MAEHFDAVVIGAGHNGLAAAATLAGKGKRVLVVERSGSVGGMAACGTLDGVAVPRLAHLVYNLNPVVAREIGVDLNLAQVPTVALSADGRHVVIEGGRARFADGSVHPDAGAFQVLHRRLVRFGGLLGQLALAPPPLLTGEDRTGDMARLAKLGLKLRLMGKTEMREFLRIVLSNARDLILDELPDGPLAGALAADAVRGDYLGPASPGTVFTLIYRLAQGGGAALPAGGMAAVAQAFATAAEKRGAVIRMRAGVVRIVVENDRATGVVLEDGTEIAAPLVLSSASAKATLQLAGVAHFDIEAARRLKNFRTRGTAAKVNLVLDKAPVLTGLDSTLARGRLLIAPSVDAVERAFNPVKYGEISKSPVIEAVIPTLTAPDPSGRHVVSAVVQYVPYAPGKGWTAAKKAALLKTVIAALDAHAPGLKASVTASEVLTPADIEVETGAPGGHWHHGEMAFDQLLTVRPANGMARYGMGPKGLFLAGGSAHPGGDITGAPGRNAALAALKAEGAVMNAQAKGVALGLVPGPFQPRLEALSRQKAWMGWAGYISPSVLDTVEFEYFAIRNQATLFDISPMHKYRVSGPDAEAMLNRVMTRNVAKIAPGRVAYTLWCDEEGMLIDDGTLFRLGKDDFRLCCQEPQLGWLSDAAWGFDVRITDESHSVAGLSLQGPTSASVLRGAGFDIDTLKPFDLADQGGVIISRTGFTGDLGYELWCDPTVALPLWDRLWVAGRIWGLRAIGYEALNLARIEAGFIAAGIEFQSSHKALRLGRGRTPFDLGFARLVDFDKGHFNGRRALLKHAETGPRTMLVRLDIAGFRAAPDALIYHNKKKEVGHVTSGIWSPTLKTNIAMAEIRAPFGDDRMQNLWAEIYTSREGQWSRRMAKATPVSGPFFRNARARLTPPGTY